MSVDQPNHQLRIVVVDDHPIVRDGLIGILSRETDMTVVGEAASGSEGVMVIEQIGRAHV